MERRVTGNCHARCGAGEKVEIVSLKPYLSLLLVIPDAKGMDYDYLKGMVTEINGGLVLPEDRLTNEVYHYDAKDRVFEKASSFEERQKMRSQKLEKDGHVADKIMQPQPMKEKHRNNVISL